MGQGGTQFDMWKTRPQNWIKPKIGRREEGGGAQKWRHTKSGDTTIQPPICDGGIHHQTQTGASILYIEFSMLFIKNEVRSPKKMGGWFTTSHPLAPLNGLTKKSFLFTNVLLYQGQRKHYTYIRGSNFLPSLLIPNNAISVTCRGYGRIAFRNDHSLWPRTSMFTLLLPTACDDTVKVRKNIYCQF